jgi:RNA polymerase sigma-70 factor, ECF subfamily
MERQPGSCFFDDFAKLLHEARGGSKAAKDDLYLPYHAVFRHWSNQWFGNKFRPERDSDIVQGIFAVAWQSFEQFQGETEEEFTSWLKRIFHNELNQIFRFQHQERRDISRTVSLEAISESKLTEGAPTPLDSLISTEEMRNLRKALKSLPNEERALITSRFGRKLSFDEMAGELGCSADAARKRLQRAMAELLHQWPEG